MWDRTLTFVDLFCRAKQRGNARHEVLCHRVNQASVQQIDSIITVLYIVNTSRVQKSGLQS